MTKQSYTFIVGSRNSKLATTQTHQVLQELKKIIPIANFEVQPFSSPGDRDKSTDLRLTPDDFFTQDLDVAVSQRKIDFAIHSAKDMPPQYSVSTNIEWFWLPWMEDSRDAIISKPFKTLNDILSKKTITIGVSSVRRENYAKQRFPNAIIKSIRGNIDERIAQLESDQFDMIIMAAAAIHRLELKQYILEYLSDCPTPQGQGYLGVTFSNQHPFMHQLRNYYCQPIRFVSAGTGGYDKLTLQAEEIIKQADIIFYDRLVNSQIITNLSSNHSQIKLVDCGKRFNETSTPQETIHEWMKEAYCQGKKVVRLKGGDATWFSRLGEEVDFLNQHKIAHQVIAGLSSMNMAGASTGFYPTRRGISRGFKAITARQQETNTYHPITENEKLTHIYYMGTQQLESICQTEITQGQSPQTPVAIVQSAGDSEQVIHEGTLELFSQSHQNINFNQSPGLVYIGEAVNKQYKHAFHGNLQGKRILVTSSHYLLKPTQKLIERYDGQMVPLPLIEFESIDFIQNGYQLSNYDWCLITSQAGARIFLNTLKSHKIDYRTLPKIGAAGPKTAGTFREQGIYPDQIADPPFGTDGIITAFARRSHQGEKILWLHSDRSNPKLYQALQESNYQVENVVLYKNIPAPYLPCPTFDTAMFLSGSAIEVFCERYGKDGLKGKDLICIGDPTYQKAVELQIEANFTIPAQFTMKDCIEKYIHVQLEKHL